MSAPLNRVLFVEDDDALRTATTQALTLAGFDVVAHGDPETALAQVDAAFEGIVVSDIRMPRLDGIELLALLQQLDPELPVILVTGHADVPMAVKALRDGAADFLTKPFATDHLVASVTRALERRALVLDNRRLRAALVRLEESDSLIGESAAMLGLREAVQRIATADVDVLIEGETGTGKELVARLIHRQGPHKGGPFVAVNCGALTESNAEAELFGQLSGSNATSRSAPGGQIALSNHGTLLLDEIDSMPLAVQPQLLRVLEEREIPMGGSQRPYPLALHVIATTKTDLAKASADGGFRADLYYRLATVKLAVPPLRDRGDDRLLLFAAFLEEARAALGQGPRDVSPAILARLRQYTWPGNVRELRNFAYEAILGVDRHEDPATAQAPLAQRVASFEAEVLRDSLTRHSGSVRDVMAEQGVPRKTLYDKLDRYGLRPSDFRS